jgi:hypothetical protein
MSLWFKSGIIPETLFVLESSFINNSLNSLILILMSTESLQLINETIIQAGIKTVNPTIILEKIRSNFNRISHKDVEFVCDKYNSYLFVTNISNFNTENKYISKERRAIAFDDFIFREDYNDEFPMPKTPLTDALFGDRDFFEMHDKFLAIDKEMKDARAKGLVKFKRILKKETDEKRRNLTD